LRVSWPFSRPNIVSSDPLQRAVGLAERRVLVLGIDPVSVAGQVDVPTVTAVGFGNPYRRNLPTRTG
jgi:hypothetical protein